MGVAPFRKQAGGNEDEFRKQTNTEAALNGLRNSLILNGTLIENVAIGTTETLVAHKLNRPVLGYIVCANDTLTQIANTNGTFNKNLFLGLKAGAPCTISLWVF